MNGNIQSGQIVFKFPTKNASADIQGGKQELFAKFKQPEKFSHPATLNFSHSNALMWAWKNFAVQPLSIFPIQMH